MTFAEEVDKQEWAGKLRKLLIAANDEALANAGPLKPGRIKEVEVEDRRIIAEGEKECPLPDKPKPKGTRGRMKKSKSRNLLERLRDFETETLLFTRDANVPFTNNQGENDRRMTKVQQKVPGCFRSMKGAKVFARIRSYINTCQKHGIKPTEALWLLFNGQWPEFMQG